MKKTSGLISLSLVLLLIVGCDPATGTTDKSSTVKPTASPPASRANSIAVANGHTYVAGWVWPYPVYWVDGVKHQVGTESGYWLYSMAFEGSDIYAMGGDFNNSKYCYWKNDVRYDLSIPDGLKFKYTYGIGAGNGHIWVAAVLSNDAGHQIPVLWRDGTAEVLSMGEGATDGGMQGSLIVSQGVAYAYGKSWGPGNYAQVWADNGASLVTLSLVGGAASAGLTVGTTPTVVGYLPGTTTAISAGKATLTFDGTTLTANMTAFSDLADSPGSRADAIAAGGTDVYVAGETDDYGSNPDSLPLLWGPSGIPVALPLPTGLSTASATGLAVSSSNDVYVVGYGVTRKNFWTTANPGKPFLWKNGSLVGFLPLPASDNYVNPTTGINMVSLGADVYLVGQTGTLNAAHTGVDYSRPVHAVWWKNGELSVLPLE